MRSDIHLGQRLVARRFVLLSKRTSKKNCVQNDPLAHMKLKRIDSALHQTIATVRVHTLGANSYEFDPVRPEQRHTQKKNTSLFIIIKCVLVEIMMRN